MRLFLDANVIFAAAISPTGRARALFTLAGAGRGILITSPFAVDEARRNIVHKYPEATGELETPLSACQVVPEGSADRLEWAGRFVPVKDAPILAAAVTARVDALVTGDRAHFGTHYGQRFEGTEVVSLAGGLELLLAAAPADETCLDATDLRSIFRTFLLYSPA